MAIRDSSLGETRMAIEKFDGKKNFSMWQVRIEDALVQQGIEEALFSEDYIDILKFMRDVNLSDGVT